MSDTTAELTALLGATAVIAAPDEIAVRSRDHAPSALLARRTRGDLEQAEAVVRPRSVQEVARLLEWAENTGTPVVPFGAGSGVCGAVDARSGVVVDMRGLDAIGPVDERSRLVTAQAGVMGPALVEHLKTSGYTLGHEPQSIAISTVGGWVATRACGQLSARFGGIEDLVVGLEAVFPGGRVARARISPRSATGPDIPGLLIGSEGTLGIVTEVTLRIAPIPTDRADLAFTFDHMAEGVAACRALAQSHLAPTLVRLYDSDDAAIAFRALDDPPSGVVLIASFDGPGATTRAQEAESLIAEADPGPTEWVEHWWDHRNDAVEAYAELMAGRGLLGEHAIVDTIEVAGTWSILRNLYHSIKDALTGEAHIVGCHLSHIYPDGACLYFTVGSACQDDATAAGTNERWWQVAMRACLDAGGTISHHHGIGRLKAEWLPEELGGWFEILRAVKGAIDPKGIMNPGAMGL